MTPYTREVDLGHRQVAVREITVGEIRAWLKDLETRTSRTMDLYSVDRDLFEKLTLADLRWFCDLTADELDALRPSEVARVLAVVEEENPDFFGLRRRMREAADRVMEIMAASVPTWNVPPASPSSEATTAPGDTP